MQTKLMRNSPWSTSRDRAVEKEEKREALLHAAAQAFSENGYYRTSLDDIAARLGVTKPTLYYYARNKEELIAAVGTRALQQIMEAFESDPNSPALDQLKHLLRRYAEVVTTDFGRSLVLLTDADLNDEAGSSIQKNKKAIDGRIRALIGEGINDGSIGACDIRLTAFIIAGAINGIARWFNSDGPETAASIAEKVANQLARGISTQR